MATARSTSRAEHEHDEVTARQHFNLHTKGSSQALVSNCFIKIESYHLMWPSWWGSEKSQSAHRRALYYNFETQLACVSYPLGLRNIGLCLGHSFKMASYRNWEDPQAFMTRKTLSSLSNSPVAIKSTKESVWKERHGIEKLCQPYITRICAYRSANKQLDSCNRSQHSDSAFKNLKLTIKTRFSSKEIDVSSLTWVGRRYFTALIDRREFAN